VCFGCDRNQTLRIIIAAIAAIAENFFAAARRETFAANRWRLLPKRQKMQIHKSKSAMAQDTEL
jgi:hypothetical protein